jgi:hypothetical protein
MGLSHSPGIVTSGLVFMIDPGNTRSYPQNTYGTICGTANEGANLTLTAPVGAIFDQIVYASYGTPNGTCGLYTNGACHATNSSTIVGTYLLNNSTGTIPATNAVFGDPCGGTYKRLYVEARFKYISSNDLTGKSNNALTVNGIGTTTDFTGVFSFDGTNDYMYLPAISQNNGASQLTWCAWMKRNASNSRMTLMQFANTNNDISCELWSDGNLYLEVGNGSNDYATLSNSSTSWQHVSMIYNGSLTGNSERLKCYINGVVQTLSYSGTIPSTAGTATTLYLGYTSPDAGPNSNLYSTGNLGVFQSYNRALSATEVRQNFNATRKRYGV